MIKYKKVRDVESPRRGHGDTGDRSAGIDFFIPRWSSEFESRLRDINMKGGKPTASFLQECPAPDGVGGTITIPHRIRIHPHSHVLIPSGITANLQSHGQTMFNDELGIAMIAFNKSSIGVKQLNVGAQIIDEDYQGEIHISLMNTSDKCVDMNFGDKIIQFAIVPILMWDMVEVSNNEPLFVKSTKRSNGGFGSTGSS